MAAGAQRLSDVLVRQRHSENLVELDLTVKNEQGNLPEYRAFLYSPEGECLFQGENCTTIPVPNPRLWWPNGLGEQPLYRLRVELLDGGCPADAWEKRIGLRTLTVSRKKDQYGENFAHQVNGVEVFAMGADYIPEDHLLGRTSAERTRRLLEDCKAANFNLVRVWGGGYYPED